MAVVEDWVKIDVQIFRHPKMVAISDRAQLVHIAAIAYCGAGRTDGYVPKGALQMLCTAKVTAKIVTELVDQKLWEPLDDGWLIHDYLEVQRSREQAQAKRTKESEGGSRGAHERWHVKTGKPDPDCPLCVPPHDRPDGVPQGGGQWGGDGRREEKRENTPPSDVTQPGAPPDPDDEKLISSVLRAIADTKTRGETKGDGWYRTVMKADRAKHGERITRLIHDHPGAPATMIADRVLDRPTPYLSHYRREAAS